jgi:hypothetical protein
MSILTVIEDIGTLFEMLPVVVERYGGKWFEAGPYDLNIIGVANDSNDCNRFDDRIIICYFDNDRNHVILSFAATTHAGTYYLENPINKNGTFVLAFGQHRGMWKFGKHRGKYKAFVQNKPVTGYRDNDRDNIIERLPDSKVRGEYGINGHRAAYKGISAEIDKHSAGCQVWANWWEFQIALLLGDLQIQYGHGGTFSYTLTKLSDYT